MEYGGYIYKGPQTKCKGCTERQLGCHDTCQAYQEAKAAWIEQKQEIKRKKEVVKQYNGFKIAATIKNNKNKWR